MKSVVCNQLIAGSFASMSVVLAQPAAAQPVAPEPAAASPVAAQATDTQESSANGAANTQDIIVTANKRNESVNRVGLTISVIPAQLLTERKITSLQEIAAVVPGLSFAQSATNTPVLTLRGIGFYDDSLGNYPAVASYNDQAPLPFAVMSSHSAFDLERIEVLKGPQGTLFGQSSTGGAINYIAAKPTSSFDAGGDISYGRFDRVEGNVYVSGPLTDTLRGRIAVNGVTRKDWQISNTRPDDRTGKQRYLAGRALLDWDGGGGLRVSLNLNGWVDRSDPQAAQIAAIAPQIPSEAKPSLYDPSINPLTSRRNRAADWSPDFAPRGNRKFYQAALRVDLDLTDTVTLTSLTAYDHFKDHSRVNEDGSLLAINDFILDGRISSFNQELRLSNGGSGPFRWVAGANFERSDTHDYHFDKLGDASVSNPALLFIDLATENTRQRIRNYAFFGNAEYDLTASLTVKAGVRYTNSRNRTELCGTDGGDGRVAALLNLLGTVLSGTPFTPVSVNGPDNCYTLNDTTLHPALAPTKRKLDEDNVAWRVGLDYKPAPGTLVYANVSRGYKAGSFPTISAFKEISYSPVTQESVMAYELGLKSDLTDRRVHINAAAFYYKYYDKQILGKTNDAVFGLLDRLINVPKSRVYGIDADISIKPLRGLTLTGSAVYLDSKITSYNGISILGVQNTDFSGSKLPFAPKWSYGADADYRYELASGGTSFIGVSVLGRSKQDTALQGSSVTLPANATTRLLPGLVYPFQTNAYASIDARLGYEAPGGAWKVIVFGKNLLNKYYWNNVSYRGDVIVRYAAQPATYGVSLGVKFK